MSLDKFLKDTTVAKQFREYLPVSEAKSDSWAKPTILVEPTGVNAPLVGTAFDYLLRFYLERINKNVEKRPWVAETAFWIIEEKWPESVERAGLMLLDAKECYSKFLKTGKLESDLIKSTLRLALLDLARRPGILRIDDDIKKENIEEIRQLYNVVIESQVFSSEERCLLNPTFGEGSELIGGADADLIIGDTLIEIKTIKDNNFSQYIYNQLIGYYILSMIGKTPTKINNIAVYFSRCGLFYKIPVTKFSKKSDFKKFVDWFVKKAKEYDK